MQLKQTNQKLERNSRDSVFEGIHDGRAHVERASPGAISEATVIEETSLIRGQSTASTAAVSLTSLLTAAIALCLRSLLL